MSEPKEGFRSFGEFAITIAGAAIGKRYSQDTIWRPPLSYAELCQQWLASRPEHEAAGLLFCDNPVGQDIAKVFWDVWYGALDNFPVDFPIEMSSNVHLFSCPIGLQPHPLILQSMWEMMSPIRKDTLRDFATSDILLYLPEDCA